MVADTVMTKPTVGVTSLVNLYLARTGNTNLTNSVSFATVDGTAVSNSISVTTNTLGVITNITITTTNNYTGTNGLVTFYPGDTMATVQVAVVGDGTADGNKQFNVQLGLNDAVTVLLKSNETVKILDSNVSFQIQAVERDAAGGEQHGGAGGDARRVDEYADDGLVHDDERAAGRRVALRGNQRDADLCARRVERASRRRGSGARSIIPARCTCRNASQPSGTGPATSRWRSRRPRPASACRCFPS